MLIAVRTQLPCPPRGSVRAALTGALLLSSWTPAASAQEAPGTPPQAVPPASTAPPDAATAVEAERRRALEAEFAAALRRTDEGAPAPGATQPAAPGAPVTYSSATPSPLRLLDLSFDLLGAGTYSTAREADLRQLEAGGHDPKNRGFTLQNVELTFAGVVDPYLRGDAHIVLLIDESGETVIELEEAWLSTLDLPFHLRLEAGQFFTEFGRLNPTHPHSWDFVDQPVVSSRFFGPDGLRSPGVQLSWLAPLPFFAEVVLSAQNSQGETVVSFRNAPEETVAGRSLLERDVRGPADLLYLARVRTSFDLAEDLTLLGGLSALFGPNATGTDTHTRIYGADVYFKWRPLASNQGWPFLAWQTEALLRRYQAAPVLDPEGADGAAGADVAELAARTTLDDAGLYSQLLWGFARPWVVGVRYDRARGERAAFGSGDGAYASSLDPLRDSRRRWSGVVSYYPSEFSKLRLQYSYDRAEFLAAGDAHSVHAQFEILFGAHGAHQF